jgi:hypothetical protein
MATIAVATVLTVKPSYALPPLRTVAEADDGDIARNINSTTGLSPLVKKAASQGKIPLGYNNAEIPAITCQQLAQILEHQGDYKSLVDDLEKGRLLLRGIRCRVVAVPPKHKHKFDASKSLLTYLGPFAFTAGSDFLRLIINRPQKEWLLLIGFDPQWIEEEAKEWSFKLVIFKGDSKAVQATWDNVFDYVIPMAFPGDEFAELRARVLIHREGLKRKNFKEIAELSPDLDIRSHVLSAEEFMKVENSLVNCRRFLHGELNLGPKFSGNGFVVNPDGSKGISEHLVANSIISKLQDYYVFEMRPW